MLLSRRIKILLFVLITLSSQSSRSNEISVSKAMRSSDYSELLRSKELNAQAPEPQRSLDAQYQGATPTKLGYFIKRAIGQPKSVSKKQSSVQSSTPFVKFKADGSLQVYVELMTLDTFILEELAQSGLNIEVVNFDLKKVQGWISRSALDTLANNSNVQNIAAPSYSRPRAGSIVTQGDAILKANELRKLGYTGKGIKVGILSDGADDWRTSSAQGELPSQITTYGSCTIGVADPQNCRGGGGRCNEGTAMAEIIHDIAPDAELAVAAVGTSLEFIAHLNRLANEFKADVIVDDLGFYGEPYFEDGDIAKAVAALPSRVLYVSSAGNSANNHYTATPGGFNSCCGLDRNIHDFGGGNGAEGLFHGFIVPRRSGVFIIMQWDDREQGLRANSDYRLDVWDGRTLTARRIIATSDIDNNATGQAIEGLCVYNPSSSPALRFATVGVSGGATFKMFFLGAQAIEHPVSRGSIFGHPAVERAIAVGTINAQDSNVDDIAFYSSQGPSQFNFIDNSLELVSKFRQKPDLVAIDGVNVSGAGGFPKRFFGTSAAAPHVAGIAAQLMSVSPLVSAKSARRALLSGTVDLGSKGFDFIYGHGRIDAQRALSELRFGSPVPAIMLLLDNN